MSRLAAFVGLGVVCLAVSGCGGPDISPGSAPIPKAPAVADRSNAPLKGPDHYKVKFETTKGDFVIEVHREWSPYGADRFHELVKSGVYDNCKFFRAVKGFMVQFGIAADPKVSSEWKEKFIPDDPLVKSNLRGFVSFAKPGMPNARTTQVFINYGDNSRLDPMGFSPFGEVVEGMDVVDQLNQEYGEETTRLQGDIYEQGNPFLEKAFPNLDAVKKATILE
jgi:peptidyl-prolyl cis-trans isomerase A (cyclophilin A)